MANNDDTKVRPGDEDGGLSTAEKEFLDFLVQSGIRRWQQDQRRQDEEQNK